MNNVSGLVDGFRGVPMRDSVRDALTSSVRQGSPIVILGGCGEGKSHLAHTVLGPDGEGAKGYALIDEAWSHVGPDRLIPNPETVNLSRTIICWNTDLVSRDLRDVPDTLRRWSADNHAFFANALRQDATFIWAAHRLGHRVIRPWGELL